MAARRAKPPSVFLSHSHRDKVHSKRLSALLSRALGETNVWMDPKLLPGEKWWRKIEGEVKKRDCLVLVGSQDAWNSVFCRAEVTEAWKHGHPVIVVQTRRASVPAVVGDEVQIVDLDKWDDEFTAEAVVDIFAGLLRPEVTPQAGDGSLWATRTTTGTQAGVVFHYKVPANLEPTPTDAHMCNTGILLASGDTVEIRAVGQIVFDNTGVRHDPDGGWPSTESAQRLYYRSPQAHHTTGNPLNIPSDVGLVGSLIGWIGRDSLYNPFFVGCEFRHEVAKGQAGFLHLAVNDHPNEYHDNAGEFVVTVSHTRPRSSS